MNWSTLKRDALEAFDKANHNLISCNLDNLNNNSKYLFPNPPFSVHGVG